MSIYRLFYAFYAIACLAGGLVGYFKAHSQVSLLVGVSSGLILLLAVYLRSKSPMRSNIAIATTALGLACYFVPAYLAHHTFMPAGLMSALSVTTLGLLLIELLSKRNSTLS
jgi:uncharacterized membrane protein (UPF0136 family)